MSQQPYRRMEGQLSYAITQEALDAATLATLTGLEVGGVDVEVVAVLR